MAALYIKVFNIQRKYYILQKILKTPIINQYILILCLIFSPMTFSWTEWTAGRLALK